ncbi:hypothetical protein PS467_12870 [Streptomyces luomodiensis]|uniref:DUF4333 domain-containing protein n=1 Tax=Streptomyces luomodiensis TaxID=3026192 RepID=A0ABY9UUP5_9ACTN|nr:hypothetical protein [Streptomyces sp. SCA4-21]WNE96166.1 hypothetical protein PS467_12870 [Streptomyces sp. SCA4-21]
MTDHTGDNEHHDSTENPEQDGDTTAVPPPHERHRPWWHWRRLTGSRLRLAVTAGVAGAVAGALLGGAGVAWRAEAGPFADDRACWGALSRDDVAALFDGKTDIETSDVPITTDRIGSEGPSGTCRLTSPRGRRITVEAHRLDTRFGGSGDQWADEFLSARLTPLGGGLLGMASDTRAWLAVPDGCLGRPSRTGVSDGPTVIDMNTGWTVYDDEVDTEARDALARAVVKLVNHYMADQGCAGTIADPVGGMPAPPRFLDEKKDAMCGVEGLPLPAAYQRDGLGGPLVTRGDGPVRTCDRDVLFDHPGLRLMTVEDPRLAVLYDRLSLDGAKEPVKAGEGDGRGFVRDDMGMFQAECQTGQVTFLVRADDADRPGAIRTLLTRYVAAEADRIGCGPLRLTLPEDG